MFMLKSPLEISSVAFAEHRVPVFLLGAKGTEPPKTLRSEIPRHCGVIESLVWWYHMNDELVELISW